MECSRVSPLWSRLSEEFLIINIRQHRCLWDYRDATYSKKKLKRKAYNDITLLLRAHFGELANISANQVRSKYNNLRSYFLKEYKKTQVAPSGSSGNYTSKWELFDNISFIKDTVNINPTLSSQIHPTNESFRPGTSSAVPDNSPEALDLEQSSLDCEVLGPTLSHSSVLDPSPTSSHSSTPDPASSCSPMLARSPPLPSPIPAPLPSPVRPNHQRVKKRKKSSDPLTDECIDAVKSLNASLKDNEINDFCSHFGKSVEHWMRPFSPKVQRLAASKIVKLLMEISEQYDVDFS